MNENRRRIRVGIGASSIMMIFVVLCMMILSLLSYSKALQKEHIADRAKLVQEEYTRADAVMQFVVKELSDIELQDEDRLLLKDHNINYEYKDDQLVLQVEINHQSNLYAVLEQQGSDMVIKTYETRQKGE